LLFPKAESSMSLLCKTTGHKASFSGHHALGLSLIRQQRIVEAVAALRRAHELSPEDARFAYVYAVALHQTGQPGDAREVLTRAARTHPHDATLREALVVLR
jgi:Flp pilus assembly protein TadD